MHMEIVPEGYSFLLISEKAGTRWALILQHALSPLGQLRLVPEEEAAQAVSEGWYDAIIIDGGAVRDMVKLVFRLRVQQPQARIVVATASPTWKRSREVLRAGAVDYIRKSLDEQELRSKIQAVLEAPPSQSPWKRNGV